MIDLQGGLSGMDDAFAYAMSIVRAADPDRYISTLYAPAEKRGALFCLYAFDIEVAGIRGRVSDRLPGEVRLQFWRDALAEESAGEGSRAAPLVDGLLRAVDTYNLPRKPLLDYLEARTFDLYDDPMPTRNDLEGYCGETGSAIIHLAAMILDADLVSEAATLSGHAGCAGGIAAVLRILPFHRARAQCYIPDDIFAATGTTRAAFLAAGDDVDARRPIDALVALAYDHMRRFERGARLLPKALRPAYLPLALTKAYLARVAEQTTVHAGQVRDIAPILRHVILLRRAIGGW